MVKYLFIIIAVVILLCGKTVWSQLSPMQHKKIDSLQHVILNAQDDTTKVNCYILRSEILKNKIPAASLASIQIALDLCLAKRGSNTDIASKTFYKKKLAFLFLSKAITLKKQGQLKKAQDLIFLASQIARETYDQELLAESFHHLGDCYLKASDYDRAFTYFQRAYNSFKKQENKIKMARELSTMGIIYRIRGDLDSGLYVYRQSLAICDELGTELAGTLNGLGAIYYKKNDYTNALKFYMMNLQLGEKNQNNKAISASLNNIGLIYSGQNELEKALEYYQKNTLICEKMQNKRRLAVSLVNTGIIYSDLNKLPEALEAFTRAKKTAKEAESSRFESYAILSIGVVHKKMGNDSLALIYLNQTIENKNNDPIIYVTALINKATIYADNQHYKTALNYALEAYELSNKCEDVESIQNASEVLYKLYKDLNQPTKALEMHELFITLKDSLESISNQKALFDSQYRYKYQKKALKDSLIHAHQNILATKNIEKQQAVFQKQKTVQRSLIIIICLVCISLLILFYAFQLKHRSNKLLKANQIIRENQHKKIIDSISYAKKIQESILPPKAELNKFSDHLVYYKPKDIVSGDFYWMHQEKDKTVIAAADCTGHGVPGAFMSMLGSSLLNEIVVKKKRDSPEEILSQLHEGIIANVQKSQQQSMHDGMDISIAVIHHQKQTIEFAGALSSLLLFSGEEHTEIKGDLKSIGGIALKTDHQGRRFTKHSVHYKKRDRIYLFSDGYIDQFGGPNRKKFGKKQFLSLLYNIQKYSLKNQFLYIEECMKSWQRDYGQIDDQMIVGFEL